ncbi:MAG TPA: SRPBCC domain-containing protein [Ktedonobacteraceae bacterium]|nr:SRPBCC domain-containing protein [Ktedonobacteraceae bacterium]
MATIVKELTIAASPERVYNALTQHDEIAHWWTNELSIRPEVGSLADFHFQQWGAGTLQFEIVKLHAAEKVGWKSRKGPPQWAGTSVSWQLTPVQSGTQLVFTHDGFAQAGPVYEQTGRNWEYFLGSLQAYLETGKGTPGAPLYK